MHINKFFKEAMAASPNFIEMLFVRDKDIVKRTPLGQKIIDNRHLFLSKYTKSRYGGFANSQKEKVISKKRGRNGLVKRFGYDTKMFSHAIRLLTSAIEILETGDFCTYRKNKEFLLEARNGKYSFKEAFYRLLR